MYHLLRVGRGFLLLNLALGSSESWAGHGRWACDGGHAESPREGADEARGVHDGLSWEIWVSATLWDSN